MLKFLDGPAAGVVLTCARAPMLLRVTHDPDDADSPWDALDQLDDQPLPSEVIHVYRLVEDHGMVHYCGRGKDGRRFGRTEQMADYRLYDQQPDDATARDTTLWLAWCETQRDRVFPPRKED